MSHHQAQGPLTADARLYLRDKHDNIIARLAGTTGKYESEEMNARRLVACWNACGDISTESLERSDVIASMQGERRRLETQRDDLQAQVDHFQALAKDNASVIVKTACDLGAMRAQRDELLAALIDLKKAHPFSTSLQQTDAAIKAHAVIAKVKGSTS